MKLLAIGNSGSGKTWMSEPAKQQDPGRAEENFRALLSWASEYEHRTTKASKQYHTQLFNNFTGEKVHITHTG